MHSLLRNLTGLPAPAFRLGLLAAALIACAGCATPRHDPWLGADKLKHFAVSAAIGAAAAAAAQEAGAEARRARGSAVLVVLTVGAGKEFHDLAVKGRWSWRDMVWNLIGGVVGAGVVTER